MQTKYRRYADLKVGEALPAQPIVFDVDPLRVAAFREATMPKEMENTFYGEAGREAEVPSMIAAVYLIELLTARKAPPGGLHAKQKIQFRRALRLGDQLSLQGLVAEKFERKGRNYVVFSFEAQCAGETVAEGLVTSVWGPEE